VDEDGAFDEVTGWEAFVHYIAMPWKLFFALIPPRRYGGGYPTFVFCLAFIALLVHLIAEIV